VTIAGLGPDWLDRKRQLKPSSFRPKEIAWRLHIEPLWGKRPMSSILFTEVQTWVTGLSVGNPKADPPIMPKAAATVIRAYGVLAAILDEAVKDRRIRVNPARGVELPRRTKKPHIYLSHDDVSRLADASKPPTLVRVLSYCGLRWGEAVALRVKDVDLVKRRIRIEQNAVRVDGKIHVGTPKSHERRTVPYPRFLSAAIDEACQEKHPDDLVFPDPAGNYMRPPHTGKNRVSWMDAAVQASKVARVTPYDLRHSAASFAVSAGGNVKAVQRMLGHSSAAMTLDVYAELFDDDLDAVAIALDAAVSK
jgi:integrase